MTPDLQGYLVLAAFAAGLIGLAAWRILTVGETWREGVLTQVFRGYTSLVFGLRSRNRCPWPAVGAALVVANHRSPVDPLIVHSNSVFKAAGNKMRVVEWLTAREYCKIGGVVQWICDTARCIPVNRHGRDMAAVKDAIRRLKEGKVVGVYPEGRLNTGGGLLDFNTGVAFLAMSTDAPVFPIYIRDAPAGETMVEPFLKPTTCDVVYGEEFDMTPYRGQRPTAILLRELTAGLRKAVADLGGIELPPEDGRRRRTPKPKRTEPDLASAPTVEIKPDKRPANRPMQKAAV